MHIYFSCFQIKKIKNENEINKIGGWGAIVRGAIVQGAIVRGAIVLDPDKWMTDA